MGTPRRRIPTNPRPSTPPFFSRISWARRTSVRSISEPDINCPFSRSAVLRTAFFLIVMPPVPYQTHNEIGKFVDEQTLRWGDHRVENGCFGETSAGITMLRAVRWRG